MRALKYGVAALACAVSLAALAAPAPFYLWQSNLNGSLTCAQTSPGWNWTRFSGPYSNAACRR
ncbi:hypothetical protein [Massilia sp. YIM B04103]|uniref:hypothetical protein n=1 Tax=Massilia sp. YIM B04103 TaxID=2963106 RepID=UPI00210BFD93|nr:hypothetical protein [Massilia sp. YIM B04103]